ncbi:MAG: cbb3-type cytochrome c oxidase subunit 3 [Deltaproteobacteria bacterium]|nr:cbb3-type cytochrome c oxidase subunit 3 [Deltaproteobacteria bacterium]
METYLEMTKPFILIVFFIFYCAVFFWAYRRKNRERLEEHKNIPFLED